MNPNTNPRRLWLVVALAFAMVLGCGKSNPVDNGGGGSITDAQRAVALSEAAGYFAALKASLSRAEAADQMAQYLRGRSEFEAADTTADGNVWGRFTDGRLAIFLNNTLVGTGNPVPVERAPLRPCRQSPNAGGYPSNIPGSPVVWISIPLGSGFAQNGVSVSDLTSMRGYTPVWRSEVEDLKDVHDVGILFVDGLGDHAELRGAAATPEYAVCTATAVEPAKEALYAADLAGHRLLYMFAATDTLSGADKTGWYYAFTAQFVQEYMSFSANSLAFVATSGAASDPTFTNAFLARGASAFAGFTGPVEPASSQRAVSVFFDRTTGDNQSDPKESPPQRAFDWQRVLTWMQSNQYDYGDEAGTSRLVVLTQGSGNTCGPLAPSIAMMYADPAQEKLYLWGIFGDNPGSKGQVTINGSTAMPVLDWGYDGAAGMDRITCQIATEGPDSYGDVQVVVGGITSNIRQLSRYKGEFTLTEDTGDGRKYQIFLTLQFRVDLLTYRTEPGGQPTYDTDNLVNADMASTGDYQCNGSTEGGDGSRLDWSGQGIGLHNNIDGASDPKGFIAGAWFDPQNLKMQVYVSGSIQDGLVMTIVPPPPGPSQSFNLNIIFGLDTFDGTREGFPSYVEVPLNSDFSISKGSAMATEIYAHFGAHDTVKLEWEDIACDSPPDPNAAREALARR